MTNSQDIIFLSYMSNEEKNHRTETEKKRLDLENGLNKQVTKLSNYLADLESELQMLEGRHSMLKCNVCWEYASQLSKTQGFTIFQCGHFYCNKCANKIYLICPSCQTNIQTRNPLFF